METPYLWCFMFFESEWSRKTIGDVDVLYHDGLYHLFHLVLPNHDFIAHAISDNALNWRRVDNALFIGNPGSWDDLMLWTMHVSPDPDKKGSWRMFYTGLSRRDQGLKQRLGLALSDDLYHWKKAPVHWEDRRGESDPALIQAARAKLNRSESSSINSIYDPSSAFPLAADCEHYEHSLDEERHWVSFRDPFFYHEEDRRLLLMAARTNTGPLIRRGCVGVMEEVKPNVFEPRPPLHHPKLYDDVEVPNLIKMEGDYYLIGSIREDAKIRYWHTSQLGEPWRNYYDNVLLAQGNYAGRTCLDPNGVLLWNFYAKDKNSRTVNNLMPPPKRLARTSNGQLCAKSFEGFDQRLVEEVDVRCFQTLGEPSSSKICRANADSLRLTSEAGFHAVVFDKALHSFRLRAKLDVKGFGKCGLLFGIDPQTHDGYYVSLDLVKGLAQIRVWSTGSPGSGERMMQFESLQSGYWFQENPNSTEVQLLSFGSYHELSVEGRVVLSLSDQSFEKGLLGMYVETADLQVSGLQVDSLESSSQSDEHLVTG